MSLVCKRPRATSELTRKRRLGDRRKADRARCGIPARAQALHPEAPQAPRRGGRASPRRAGRAGSHLRVPLPALGAQVGDHPGAPRHEEGEGPSLAPLKVGGARRPPGPPGFVVPPPGAPARAARAPAAGELRGPRCPAAPPPAPPRRPPRGAASHPVPGARGSAGRRGDAVRAQRGGAQAAAGSVSRRRAWGGGGGAARGCHGSAARRGGGGAWGRAGAGRRGVRVGGARRDIEEDGDSLVPLLARRGAGGQAPWPGACPGPLPSAALQPDAHGAPAASEAGAAAGPPAAPGLRPRACAARHPSSLPFSERWEKGVPE